VPYQITAFPTVLLLGPNGEMLGKVLGATPSSAFRAFAAQVDGFAADGTITQAEIDSITYNRFFS